MSANGNSQTGGREIGFCRYGIKAVTELISHVGHELDQRYPDVRNVTLAPLRHRD